MLSACVPGRWSVWKDTEAEEVEVVLCGCRGEIPAKNWTDQFCVKATRHRHAK